MSDEHKTLGGSHVAEFTQIIVHLSLIYLLSFHLSFSAVIQKLAFTSGGNAP
jgi:hypothetical protein